MYLESCVCTAALISELIRHRKICLCIGFLSYLLNMQKCIKMLYCANCFAPQKFPPMIALLISSIYLNVNTNKMFATL